VVVRAMHAALGRGLSALLNCHGSFLQQISQILKRSLGAGARALLHIPSNVLGRCCRLVALADCVQRH
jgi:hypothetical protein